MALLKFLVKMALLKFLVKVSECWHVQTLFLSPLLFLPLIIPLFLISDSQVWTGTSSHSIIWGN